MTKSQPILKQRNRKRIGIVSALLASIGLLAAPPPQTQAQNVGPGPNSGYNLGSSPYAPSPNGSPYGTGQAYSTPNLNAPNQYVPNQNVPNQNVPNQAYGNGQQQYAPQPGMMPASPPVYNQPYQQPIPPPTYNGQPVPPPNAGFQTPPPLEEPWNLRGSSTFLDSSPYGAYDPRIRDIPVDVYVQEAQTGRFSVGGSVNSDLGVAGNFILEERNFDIRNFPSRPSDLLNGAFRGAGQNFRAELVPGNLVQRYTLNWTEPNLFGYSPFSLSVGGFYFTRIYRDWTEQRLGARVAVGYEVTPDLSLTTELRGEDVKISDRRVLGLPALDRVAGSNDLYTGRVRIAHSTKDSPFLPTEGHLLELIYDQTFGEFDFPRGQVNFSRYFLVRQRADGGGRHTFTSSMRLGFTGEETPLFENFFAGGVSTMRGFAFRGASPVDSDIQVGGRFQMLGTFEYMLPITADDMLRMVAFVDYGTVEKNIELNSENFRVAPGFGARIAVPALGPAPLAFDFAFPVAFADSDTRQIFSFTMGLTR